MLSLIDMETVYVDIIMLVITSNNKFQLHGNSQESFPRELLNL